MITAAQQSGEIIRNNFRQDTSSQNKTSHLDIVTQTDLDSQQEIHKLLVDGMTKLGFEPSEIGFIEEESSSDSLKKHNFIVDPIDGTTNFAAGIPFSSISIAYALEQDLKIGVILDPFSQTLYWGESGQGSYLQNQLLGKRELKLKPKPKTSWMVGAHLNGPDTVESQFKLYQKIFPQVRGLRNIGSVALDISMMADNVFDLILNQGCFMWDLAAARVILEEAGGQLYDYDGNQLQFNWHKSKKKYQLFACHPDIKNQVMEYL